MSDENEKVLLIIPAYNEEESIASTINSVRNFMSTEVLNFHLDYIVVNDGSKDRTPEIVKEMNVDLINLRTNLGLTGGFGAGMKYAHRHDYDYAIQFDADGQHLPDYIPEMVTAARKGNNIVVGSRFVDEKRPKSLRMLGNTMISTAIKMTTGQTINDPTSGMRLFDKKAIEFYVKTANMAPEPETISYLIKKKFKVKEVQVAMQDRLAGESYLNLRRSIEYMTRVAISILVLQPFRK
ncbi:glycosyltransferase family 2 protein [Lactococcus lactis subsp. lactis]|jgi:Glycosyltransferases involved in cell wall biogenesis|uniref:glycosyltransferase family 2 protein n=1 Tax=Lactococcus lactis TaxID=1358 RepID=UPI00223B5674|nr:glycosyltransferase family 2 protein [Lactococcus lactis]MCT0016670.1 glycosyltransferase family 2 protein [Lactococcus lactis subsp. lactis]